MAVRLGRVLLVREAARTRREDVFEVLKALGDTVLELVLGLGCVLRRVDGRVHGSCGRGGEGEGQKGEPEFAGCECHHVR